MSTKILISMGIIVIASVCADAALFLDNFDVDSSADWNIITSSADTSVIFAFDYSTIGVPPAPNGDGTTLGLRMAANMNAPTSTEAVTLSPVDQNFSGSYILKFDMWINANGPLPGGGGGSTEFLTCGIGYDDITVNQGGASGSGGWFAVSGEGGSSRDFRAYKNGGEQFPESTQFVGGATSSASNASDAYYADFGGVVVEAAVPEQTALHPNQAGTMATGSVGFEWHEVIITVDGDTAVWEIDGLPIVDLNPNIGASFPLSGNISIGYMDIFTSVSDNPEVSFGLIDNLVVMPDPSVAYLANSPTPPDNAKQVSIKTSLQWEDPLDVSPIGYDVYLGTDSNDLSPGYFGNFKVVDNLGVNIYEPADGELETETLYFWRVDSYVPNEGGNPVYNEGNVWNFMTAPPEPLIEDQPERVVTVTAGESAQLSIKAVNADSYTWYKVSDSGADIIAGADTDTLTIDNVGLDQEGYYFCSVTNETEVVVDSDLGRILTRRKMAHWKFDGDLGDEVDSVNDGTSPGAITFAGGIDGEAVKIGGTDEFVQIDNEIGLLNEVSISMWVNPPASVLNESAILIVPQDGDPNYGGIGSVSLTSVGSELNVEVRGEVDDSAGTILADAWNHLLFVYTPGVRKAEYYINGELAGTVTGVDPGVLANVTALGIGARNASDIMDIFEQGLIDDVRIYNFELSSLNAASLYTEFIPDASICLDGVLPEYDLNGDCIFDLKDFAQIAATWLECNLVPDCIEPEMP